MKLTILFLCAVTAQAVTFAFVQSKSQSGNTALAFTSNNTAGNTIFVIASAFVSAVSDTQGNTYHQLTPTPSNLTNNTIATWIATNIKAGANSVSTTGLNASGAHSSIAILEYTAPHSFNVVATTSQSWNGAMTASTGSETLNIYGIYDFGSSHTWTVFTNVTLREQTSETGGQTLGVSDADNATVAFTSFQLGNCSGGNNCGVTWVTAVATPGGGGGGGQVAYPR